MSQKFFALMLLVFTFSITAPADHRYPGARAFTKLIEEYKVACISSPCQKPFKTNVLYRENSVHPSLLSRSQLRILDRVAKEQAKIWADTILEGDYVSDGNTVLEKVVGIYRNNTLVAYKISYAERGWDISSCGYEQKNPGTRENCPEGIIRETSFVSTNFENYVRNHDDIADFYQVKIDQ
jgi:hypothetical protein